MSDANRIGRIVSPHDVETAIVAALNLWMDDYLGEIERLYGYAADSIERPRAIIRYSEFQKRPEDQTPCILVLNAGMAGQPVRRAQGAYDAIWQVSVISIVSDTDEETTRDLAEAYTVAVRTALLQHKKFKSDLYPNGFATFTEWMDEQYHDIPALQARSLDSGRVVLNVGVENVLTEQAGPRTPTTPASQDPGPWPPLEQVPAVTTIPLNPTEAVQ